MKSFIIAVAADNWKKKIIIMYIDLIGQRDSLLGIWWNLFHQIHQY